jgi:hypothetical protein
VGHLYGVVSRASAVVPGLGSLLMVPASFLLHVIVSVRGAQRQAECALKACIL